MRLNRLRRFFLIILLGFAASSHAALDGNATQLPSQSSIADYGSGFEHGDFLLVTTLADSGPGSLRQAISDAERGAKIKLAVLGTIFLTSGPLTIDKDLVIAGPCEQRLVIDSQRSGAIFFISNCVDVTISDLTVSNGLNSVQPPEGNGGAIRNFGTLTLIRVQVLNSSSEAIGGGIYNHGTLALRQCLVSKNSAPFGGGIGDDGFSRLTIDSSTLSSNIAAFPEGSSGGGIWKLHDIGLVTNSTISGNIVAEGVGGGIAAFCYFRFESCTIVSNAAFSFETTNSGRGGGLFINTGICVESRNSIFAGNRAAVIFPGITNGPDIFGVLFSQGYNLIQNPVGSTIAGLQIGNLTGVNPVLGPLEDNGGPTPTHALLTGSPAIDAGSPYDFPRTDQRGVARPQDGNGDLKAIADIGAYEKESIIPGDIPGNIIVTSLANSGPGTLREALNTAPPGSKITFAVQGTIQVDDSLLITRNLLIAGPGVDKLFLTGFSPVFVVTNCAKAILADVTITNAFRNELGPSGFGGGAVRNFGDFTMIRCVVTDCGSEFGTGGGIYTEGALTLHQCSISNNLTEFGAGVGDVGDGRLVIDSCTINNNLAINSGFEGLGGGIVKFSGLMWMSNSTISGNRVFPGDGGGLAVQEAYVFLDNCTIVSNNATSFLDEFGRGGGIFKLDSSTVEIRNTIVAGNSALTAAFTPHAFVQGPDLFGWFFSQGWNLIQNPSNSVLAGVLTGNIIGADPRLGSLVNNGGPTLTHALLKHSPAIDKGSPFTFVATDQRGVPRPQDGNGDGVAIGDIGAFEKEAPQPGLCIVIKDLDSVCVTGSGVAEQEYTIQTTESLASPQWVSLTSAKADINGKFEFIDTQPRVNQTRFYRVIITPKE